MWNYINIFKNELIIAFLIWSSYYYSERKSFGGIVLEKGKLIIDSNWCKGCGICVEYCPKKILKLENNTIAVEDIEKCILCGLCELRCPDYAIYISKNV